MKKVDLPVEYVATVQGLYQGAESIVIINGERSTPFLITRGVRQGDPLSFLLFNLAIEPLAQMLRVSELEGYRIPNLKEHIVAMLFADDTTVYLSKNDKFEHLLEILDQWCIASGAKFNINKTVVIPIGTPEYRSEVIVKRKIGDNQSEIPEDIQIAPDGEASRILGAFLGNNVDDAAPWTSILEDIESRLQ